MPQVKYESFLKLEPIGKDYETNAYALQGNTSVVVGQALGMETRSTANDTQTITAPGSGNFQLSFGGQTTPNIAYNASDATIQAALAALSTIGTGNVAVASKVVTFQGVFAGQAQPVLTDPTGAATIAHTSTGRTQYAVTGYTDGAASNIPFIGLAQHACTSDNYGNMFAGASTSGTAMHSGLPAFIKGRFNANDLTGLTTTALSGRGTVEKGSISTGTVRLF